MSHVWNCWKVVSDRALVFLVMKGMQQKWRARGEGHKYNKEDTDCSMEFGNEMPRYEKHFVRASYT